MEANSIQMIMGELGIPDKPRGYGKTDYYYRDYAALLPLHLNLIP